MIKKTLLAVLLFIVIGTGLYVVTLQVKEPATSATTVTQTPAIEYYIVPELKLRFQKVAGITPVYTIKNKYVTFSSAELKAAAIQDPTLNACVDDALATLSISKTAYTQYGGFEERKLSNGTYLDIAGPQAPCTDGKTKQPSLDLVTQQRELFFKFIATAEVY